LSGQSLIALCRALPLCRVRCDCVSSYADLDVALPVLRREPPFALLTIGMFCLTGDEQSVLDLASALSVHSALEHLIISEVPLTNSVDALVDAAISAGIKKVGIDKCGLSQTALPALGRLLQSPGFELLGVWNDDVSADHPSLFEGPALPTFFEALRNSTSLKTLKLEDFYLWKDMAVATQLFAVLEVLPALQELSTAGNYTDGTPAVQQAAGECLARLIARSTSLQVLKLSGNELGENGLAPIFGALRNNSSLVELKLWSEHISADFARDVVLPAVRANTCLRKFGGLLVVKSRDAEVAEDPSLQEASWQLAGSKQGCRLKVP